MRARKTLNKVEVDLDRALACANGSHGIQRACQFVHMAQIVAKMKQTCAQVRLEYRRHVRLRPMPTTRARADVEVACRVFLSKRNPADFQAWRDQQAWTAEKYRHFDQGERMAANYMR
jgi:hypothetical protein